MELVTVGIDDGVMDSVAVRFAVGIELGVLVGVVVGISLEIVVSLLEGFSAGVDVGIKNVCVVLGAPLGDFVGTSVRNKVWYCEGSGVSDVGRDIEGADNVFGSSPFVGDRLGISLFIMLIFFTDIGNISYIFDICKCNFLKMIYLRAPNRRFGARRGTSSRLGTSS